MGEMKVASSQMTPRQKSVNRTHGMRRHFEKKKHLLGQAPEGWLATPRPTLARGMYANRLSRILNSLQTVSLPTSSNHVGTTRESLETMPAG
jgi:hypothetical protein